MRTTPMLLALATALFAAACTGSSTDGLEGSSANSNGNGDGNGADGTGNDGTGADGDDGNPNNPPEHTVLDDRVVDYNEALRTASLKLVRALPTLEQIKRVQEAADPKAAYEQELDAMFADPRFAGRMFKWWRDVMRQGGGANGDAPSRDTAPALAARLVIEEQPYTNLFTQASNNCPSFDGQTNTFADGECNNNAPVQAGVLTNPGVMYQFYSNMAFRRLRWVQEIFACTKFPAEYSATPVKMGAADYTSPWDFNSITGGDGEDILVNFKDTSSVICANCHTTSNHQAPLFANFDMNGMWQDSIQVQTPAVPEPVTSKLSDWLPDGQQTAWRFGKPAADLAAFGAAMAEDPIIHECAVARAWNFAMSKEDIVSEATTVPTEILAPYMAEFKSTNFNFKKVLISIFKSEDFVRF